MRQLGALLPRSGRAAVPGMGRGFDAELLARRGLHVTGVDISETAVEAAREPRERAAPRYDGWLQETCGFDPFRLLGLLAVLTVGITVPALSW